MADTAHDTKSDDKAAPVSAASDAQANTAHISHEAWPVGAAANISPAESRFDAHKVAADINDALHVPFFSLRVSTDGERVFNDLKDLSPQQYKAVQDDFNKTMAPGDKPFFSGEKAWDLAQDVKAQLSSGDSDRIGKLMESKTHNDVPSANRVDGQALLKPGSPLKVGEISPVTLPDGRRYDVYVPKNADNRAPVIVAMHGAAGGDSVGLMAQESGLTADAERTGATVVFAYPEARKFDTPIGKQAGVAWNVPGRINLPKAADSTDDRQYLDNVLNDLGRKTTTANQVGMFGFSDGGRMAQAYAADRPDRVAAVVTEDGTWMKGDREPGTGKPIMIVHGDKDQTLPYKGGLGNVSSWMDWALGTNLDKSAPYMQSEVWSKADQCDGPVAVHDNAQVTSRDYTGCKVGEVREYILKGGQHGINDYKNDGSRFAQWLLGSADRSQDFASQGADFLKKWIVSDPSMKRPG